VKWRWLNFTLLLNPALVLFTEQPNLWYCSVRGWATRSSDGRTHAGYILNPGKSMRAYAVPGQRITL
jgi:hypothetical protein